MINTLVLFVALCNIPEKDRLSKLPPPTTPAIIIEIQMPLPPPPQIDRWWFRQIYPFNEFIAKRAMLKENT